MRLLVSVRTAEEVAAAVAGGADIIDAKEPRRGPLGPVSPRVLSEILRRVPRGWEASAALGDFTDPSEVREAIAALPAHTTPLPLYLKLGFAGVSDAQRIVTILKAAASAGEQLIRPAPRIVAVAYGDNESADAVAPETIFRMAAAAGAAGLLVDTYSKGSGSLFNWMTPERLRRLTAEAADLDLLCAIAGGLGADDLETVCRAAPDIVGFRGAACSGGREGSVDQPKVRKLRKALTSFSSAFLQADAEAGSRLAKRPIPPRISAG